METLYYTPIQLIPLCSNGSEKYGVTAKTTLSFDPNRKFIEVNITGKNKVDAEKRLLDFLGDDEQILLQLVEPKESEGSNG